ncbi:MAG: ATP-dependent helicase [Chitinispirillales bacterium]|jgi:superfamily I DNA/RNA helicase|nr:ATP-dependent helicase [Chitinispirillales bacterium]
MADAVPFVDCSDILSTLNPEQLAAVTAANRGSLLVLAGAGCGKTAVLTRRIVYLTRLGIPAGRICALTFSRKAALEMAHRLAKLDPSCVGANAPLVTTFHAFALRVLLARYKGVRNFSRIGFDGDAQLLDGKERFNLMAQASSARVRKSLRMGIVELGGALDLLSTFPEKAARKWDGEELKLLAKIGHDFSALRKARGLWDFSDLICGGLELFSKHPEVAADWSGRFDAVLVDEFQDTNPMQIDMLDILLRPGSSLYAVGDDDQAIYGFRGADIRPIRNFTARFRDARIVKLQINYRSVTAILDCANRLWANKPAEYRKTLVSGLKTQPAGCRKPKTMRFSAQGQALEWILGRARFIARRENIPIGEMAVLFRINDTLSAVSERYKNMGLSSEGIPQLLTVHASKGLEYPVVFLCDLEEGVFPHYKLPKESSIDSWVEFVRTVVKPQPNPAASCDIDEELRLFYVGVTRAQRYLFFVTVSKKQFYGRETKFVPSRFLKLVK